MKALPIALGDVALAVFAVAVITGAVVVVTDNPAVSNASLVSSSPLGTATPSATAAPSASPTAVATAVATATATPSVTPAALETLVVAGPDFSRLQEALELATGATIVAAEGGTEGDVLADGALAAIRFAPSAVVLEVTAGTRTSIRTTEAIQAVRDVWPEVPLYVVGPFSSADRKSAAAVKSAATNAQATFLDPVELGWRADATSAQISEADIEAVASKLADAIR